MQSVAQQLRAEGIQQGIQAGIAEASRRYILKMKAKNYDNSEIAEIMGLDNEDVARILEEIAH